MRNRSPLTWRKSTYSSSGGNCVEVAAISGGVAVRDSKAPDAGMIVVSRRRMAVLLDTLKIG